MNDKTLVCTSCDSVVTTASGYDGYFAECGHDHFSLSVGSNGETPYSWGKWGDLQQPSNFKVYLSGHIRNNEKVSEPHVVCSRCNSSRCNDEENIELTSEEVDIFGCDLKITFTCTNDHYYNDKNLESLAYYDSKMLTGMELKMLADQ